MEKQHVQHEATRYAAELQHVETGRIKPVGTLAFASIYAQAAPSLEQAQYREYYVERRLACGMWITAEREMQRKNINLARELVKGMPQYRVVVHMGNGNYKPMR